MAIISIRYIYPDRIAVWERLEAKGKIGPQQRKCLNHWRALKQRHPNIQRMSIYTGMEYLTPTEEGAKSE
jgi:hypothetical protein